MEAHGRGRGSRGEPDPADQWVFNPDTGDYELRVPGPQGLRSQPRARATFGMGSAYGAPPRQRRAPSSQPPPESAAESTLEVAVASRSAAPATAPGRRRSAPPDDQPLPGQRDRRAPRSRRKTKTRSRKKTLKWVGGGLAMLMLVASVGVWFLYQKLNGNLTSVDVSEDTGYEDGEPVNILIIGTDNRTGDGNTGYGNEGDSGRADTTILMHFSADRTNATGLSIPRDLITDIPDCEVTNEDGTTTVIPGSQDVRFNESLGVSGRDPGCTWKTVEQMTGVEIDHFLLADFNAVKDLSTAVGGVEVCVSETIDDPKSGLYLEAGRHTLEGEEALAFVRTRYSVGDGSDLSRIKLQQQFLASLAREVTSVSLTKLWSLADTATKALTVDDGISSVKKLYDLARDLGQVPMSDMSFITLPTVNNSDGATVSIDESNAEPIFEMLQKDISMTEDEDDEENGDGGGDGGKNGEEQEKAPASEVRVDVYNGGDVVGAAQETVTWLQNEKCVTLSTNSGNAAQSQESTTLEYGRDQADQAATLADMLGLGDSALKEQSENWGDTPMTLVLGNDFTSAGQSIDGDPEKPDDVESITADDKNVCAS